MWVASQSCNHGLAFPAWLLSSHTRGRTAELQAQHPGANLQNYVFSETWGHDDGEVLGIADSQLLQTAGMTAEPQYFHSPNNKAHTEDATWAS